MRRSTKWTLVGAAVAFVVLTAPAGARAAQVTASCYGPGLYGNHTANGTVLTPQTEGIAHRSLPLGTPVVLYAPGRRAAFAKVIDRGPFVSGRSVDVTSATARRLGYSSCATFGVRRLNLWIVKEIA